MNAARAARSDQNKTTNARATSNEKDHRRDLRGVIRHGREQCGLCSFGRQYTMTFWALQDSDLLGPDIYGGMGTFDNYVPNARGDNTVAWKGKWHGVTAGATWSFGRDAAGTGNSPGQGTCAGQIPGDSGACRQCPHRTV